MSKSAQRQFLVKIAGIDGYFMTKSGGDLSASSNKVYDGGSLVPEVMAGPAEAANITVSRAYDVSVDASILANLRSQVSRYETTISVTPTNRDLVAVAPPVTYPNALLIGLTEPEFDASSGDAATYSLEFAVGQVV